MYLIYLRVSFANNSVCFGRLSYYLPECVHKYLLILALDVE